MASIERRTRNGQVRWYTRYRSPNGQQRTKTFDRKIDAERYLTTIESSKLTGSYIDPAAARLTLGPWAHGWLDGQTHLKPSTRERYAGILRAHIVPAMGLDKIVRRQSQRSAGLGFRTVRNEICGHHAEGAPRPVADPRCCGEG